MLMSGACFSVPHPKQLFCGYGGYGGALKYMSCKNMPHTDSQNKITILFSLQFQVANLNVVTWAESDAARCEFTILHMAGVICRV